MINFDAGDRVTTPGGIGTVVYRRMAGPDYSKVEVYSVKLDAKKEQPNYSGTVYPAKDCNRA